MAALLAPEWINRVSVHAQERFEQRYRIPADQTGPLLEDYRQFLMQHAVMVQTYPIIEDSGCLVRLAYALPADVLERGKLITVTGPGLVYDPKHVLRFR